MATLTLTISKLRFPGNANISNPITATLEYKEYYATSFTLIDSGVNIDVDGTILDSPLPTITVDPTLKYVIRCTNELCDFQYEQTVIINPYCPVGYELAPDETYCFYEEVTDATPPSSTELTVAKSANSYSTCGSYIYASGYNVNGTGTSAQITTANPFWVNGAGACVDNNSTDGPLNRSGLWATTALSNQTVGFAICIDINESKTYYIGMGCDNLGIIELDGEEVVHQDPAALAIQYGADAQITFKIWHIYPVFIPSGSHVISLIGYNQSSVAAMGMEIYDNTSAELIAATDYTGLNLVFSTKDYVGQPLQLGSDNLGYSCPAGYSLRTCSSPYECVRIVTTPILY